MVKRKKKALILIDHGSKVREANDLLIEVKKKLQSSPACKFDIVEHCHMELCPPTLEEAFSVCCSSGVEEVVVHPYFLVPGRHSKTDIPDMVKAALSKFPNIECKITEPLGLHDKIIEVIIEHASLCQYTTS